MGLRNAPLFIVFKSLVQSGFLAQFWWTATATGCLTWKVPKNWTETEKKNAKNRSKLVWTATGANRFEQTKTSIFMIFFTYNVGKRANRIRMYIILFLFLISRSLSFPFCDWSCDVITDLWYDYVISYLMLPALLPAVRCSSGIGDLVDSILSFVA